MTAISPRFGYISIPAATLPAGFRDIVANVPKAYEIQRQFEPDGEDEWVFNGQPGEECTISDALALEGIPHLRLPSEPRSHFKDYNNMLTAFNVVAAQWYQSTPIH